MPRIVALRKIVFGVSVILSAVACSGADDAATDTVAGASGAAATPSDTGMGGMDHSSMADMGRPPATDGDHEFLRMMSDHHEGLIQMASAAMTKASTPAVQGDAHQLHTKQEQEQTRMVEMVQTMYNEKVTPMIVPSNKAMNDSLQSKSGRAYDRTFYANVVAHHQEGIRMIDDMLPRLTNPEVKQMAEKMKADQQKEIAELQSKMR